MQPIFANATASHIRSATINARLAKTYAPTSLGAAIHFTAAYRGICDALRVANKTHDAPGRASCLRLLALLRRVAREDGFTILPKRAA